MKPLNQLLSRIGAMVAALLLLVLMVSMEVRASVTADLQATWDAPTQFVDGSDAAPEDIAGYRLRCLHDGDAVVDAELDADATEYQTTLQLSDGNYECRLTVFNQQGRPTTATAEFSLDPELEAPANFRTTISITFGG
ncbi:MAG: hypothetical protein JJU06_05840 [Ectothiorhodospiraceae bacterium]|nr:hypothetical protein [Ectothiorhodospiraceae bacterium]MCH8502903.1 hypothetical protein [Ectothiorhodospiraceae bacterium]